MLSTNDYVRIPDSKQQDAVALLQDTTSLRLNASQLSFFAPTLSTRSDPVQPYLVRGVTFSSRPVYTNLRFDAATNRLLVEQATWDGEIMLPFRWVAEPNTLVVFLPQAPEHVYAHPILGGDRILRGTTGLDSR